MTTTARILGYGTVKKSTFTKKELLDTLTSETNKVSENALSMQLSRLVASGQLERVGRGVYKVVENAGNEFVYKADDEMQEISNIVKEKFPFTDYCIWRPSVLNSLMQHNPTSGLLLLDIEREAMSSVFYNLKEAYPTLPILLSPTKQEIDKYSSNSKMLIIRPLVGEAPIVTAQVCRVPTIEKILVDIVDDKELVPFQGAELHTIYSNAFEQYNIKKSRMLRYAARRNRKAKVEHLLNTIVYDTPRQSIIRVDSSGGEGE